MGKDKDVLYMRGESDMKANTMTRAKQGLAALVSFALIFSAPAPAIWANAAAQSGVVTTVPAGIGSIGVAGVAGVNTVQVPLTTLTLPHQDLLSTQFPTVNLKTTLPDIQAQADLKAVTAVPQTLAAAPQGVAVERHPVIGILNALQKSGGGDLIQKFGTASSPDDIEAIAKALPEGAAKDNLIAFARIAATQGGAGAGAQAFDGVAEAKNVMPVAEAAQVQGVWGSLSKSRLVPSSLRRYAAQKAESQRQKAGLIDTDALKVPIEKLRWVPNPTDLPASTREIQGREKVIVGQQTALEALDFGLKMPGPGYNVIVTGPAGSGRETSVTRILEKIAPTMETPADMVSGTNFSEPSSPIILEFEAGEGAKFRAAAGKLIQGMAAMLPQVLNSGEIAQARKQIEAQAKAGMQAKQAELDAEVAKITVRGEFGVKISIQQTGEDTIGIGAVITHDGNPIQREELAKILEGKGVTEEELFAEVQAAAQPFMEQYAQMLQENQGAMGEAQEKMMQLQGQVVTNLVNQLAAPLIKTASGSKADPKVMAKFKQMMEERQAAWEAEVAATKVGPFTLMMQIGDKGVSLGLLHEGEPADAKTLAALQEGGVVGKDVSWKDIIAQAKTAAGPLVQKYQEMMSEIQAAYQEIQKKTPALTPRQRAAVSYAKALMTDLVRNHMIFVSPEAREAGITPEKRYKIGVVVDNSRTQGAPVIFENNPTFQNLFGSVEDAGEIMMSPNGMMAKKQNPGGPTLVGGSYLKANGGYLVINLNDLVREPNAYPALMRMVRSGRAEIIEGGAIGMANGGTSYSMPAKVKVVLIGSPMMKMMLRHYDEEFSGVFRASAEFASSMKIAADSVAGYLSFMRNIITRSTGLIMEMTRDGIAEILEFGSTLSGSNERLSTQFGSVASLMREASFYAKEAGRDEVGGADVQKAIAQRLNREGGSARRMQELYTSGTFKIDTQGYKVGQINGLAVIGDEFGIPARITAQASAGSAGGLVISADKVAGTTGASFNKALAVLEGFFEGLFGQQRPINARVRISFEQNYGGIDGDSATQTQIYASLSALSNVPLNQGIAITGSADQFGNVQAIGGVNHKIGGYFDVAKVKGLDGTQGVIIPKANITELMLRPDIVEAIKAGKFHIWAVEHVSQGVEILTQQPYSEVVRQAAARMGKMGAK
ncbi:MAG: hypothetical protein A2X36_01515 [Elusimicrobia bacterium GWA2_69_24]|nr:MAG: hypothetical protein A2X36_01515 [Elusimicrobia bacterium GWA2_69_24]